MTACDCACPSLTFGRRLRRSSAPLLCPPPPPPLLLPLPPPIDILFIMSRTPQLPAAHAPTLHLSSPSWRGVASQLKSLLVGSPLLTASLVAVGVGSAVIAYASSERARRRQRERRRALRLVRARFDECRLDILKYIFEQEWNRFTVAQLDQLYAAFSSLLSNRHRGVIPLTSLAGIIRAAGVSDDRVNLACAKFFDQDGNCQV